MPRRDDPNSNYLKTWQSINQAGGPNEPVRSHRLLSEEPRLTSGRGKKIRPLLESEPLTESSIPSFVKNRLPMGDITMGELNPTGDTDEAISWFSTKENRAAAGLALLTKLRGQYAEGSDMRNLVEKTYENYPRTFAHLGDINLKADPGAGAAHSTEKDPRSKFTRYTRSQSEPVRETDVPGATINKLNKSRESALINETYPRTDLIDNAVKFNPKFLDKGYRQWTEEAMRHELNHAAQNIRRPFEHPMDVTVGRGQLKGLRDFPEELKDLDYKLEPVEVGARFGEARGLDRKTKKIYKPTSEEIAAGSYGIDTNTSANKFTSERPAKSHADLINDELDRISAAFKKVVEAAPNKPIHAETYGASFGGKPIQGKKLAASKSEYEKSEAKTYAKSFEKIRDLVLPTFNRARPVEDQMVFTLRDKPINIDQIIKKPEDLGEFIREIRVKRASKARK